MSDREQAIKALEQLQQTMGQQFLPDDEFADQFKSAWNNAKMLMERDNYLDMVFLAHMRHREKAEWTLVPMLMADWPPPDDMKYEVMFGLGAKLADQFPDHMLMSVVQISEAWMAEYANEDVIEDSPYLPKGIPMPSQRQDKVECVIIDGCTMDQRKCSVNMPFTRKPNGTFEAWGKERINLHKPGQKFDLNSPRNFLVEQMFMGNLAAVTKNRSKK